MFILFLLFPFLTVHSTPSSLLGSPSIHYVKNDDIWRRGAIEKLWNERDSMGRTPLVPLKLPSTWKAQIFLKNESAAVTESLKHRYAWALFMWALVEGKIHNDSTIYEASSGNSACSEAYFAKQLNLPFVAIVPDTLEDSKVERITKLGSSIIKVPLGDRITTAARKANETGGFFMNQFANADKAEEYHTGGMKGKESVNVFSEILNQMNVPSFFVHSAGTGGTLSSAAKLSKKYALKTRMVLADTQFSVYGDYVLNARFVNESGKELWAPPGMAGIGFGTAGEVKIGETTSLRREIIDIVVKVPDIASTAAMAVLQEYGVNGGTSTGINLLVSLSLAAKNNRKGTRVVTLLADPSKYYTSSYLNETWIEDKMKWHGGIKTYNCWKDIIRKAIKEGRDPLILGGTRCSTK